MYINTTVQISSLNDPFGQSVYLILPNKTLQLKFCPFIYFLIRALSGLGWIASNKHTAFHRETLGKVYMMSAQLMVNSLIKILIAVFQQRRALVMNPFSHNSQVPGTLILIFKAELTLCIKKCVCLQSKNNWKWKYIIFEFS